MKTELNVLGMTCGHCVSAVRSALLGVPGVLHADVSLSENRAIVDYDESVSVDRLIAVIADEGYEAQRHTATSVSGHAHNQG